VANIAAINSLLAGPIACPAAAQERLCVQDQAETYPRSNMFIDPRNFFQPISVYQLKARSA
jgi:hypothetical protein